METHSGDTPINRLFSFWGAIGTFLSFGGLALLFAGFESMLMRSNWVDPDHARRGELDAASRSAQAELVSSWKANDDGTYEVPAAVAVGWMKDKLAQPRKSSVPVPGTKAAAEAAEAAAAAAEAAVPAGGNAAPAGEDAGPAGEDAGPAGEDAGPAGEDAPAAGDAGQPERK